MSRRGYMTDGCAGGGEARGPVQYADLDAEAREGVRPLASHQPSHRQESRRDVRRGAQRSMSSPTDAVQITPIKYPISAAFANNAADSVEDATNFPSWRGLGKFLRFSFFFFPISRFIPYIYI